MKSLFSERHTSLDLSADDHVIVNAPSNTGFKFRTGASATDYTVWHAGNDGSGSGLDADLLDGYQLSTTRNAANTVPVRDANGYLQLGWINTTSGDTSSSLSRIYVDTGDGYIRKSTLAHVASQLPISAGANNDIFWENGQTVTSNYTITNGKNAMSAGPITINSGVTVTVGAGETWTVV